MGSLLSRVDEQLAEVSARVGVSERLTYVVLSVLGVGLGTIVLWRTLGEGRFKLPPGPRRLPLIGNLHNMGSNPKQYLVFSDLHKKFGDIVTIYLGPKRLILLTSADIVRETFIRDGLSYVNRPKLNSLELMTNGGKDIIGAPYGSRLQMQRKLALAALRKYASGVSLEHHMDQAFQAFSKEIDSDNKFLPHQISYLVAYNILASMCFGRSFEFDDPFMRKMMGIQQEFETAFESPAALVFLLPFMKYFPSKLMAIVRRFSSTFKGYINKCFKEHMESYNPDKLTDFTYHVIHTWKEAEADPNERNKLKELDEENFSLILLDLFLAGTETTRLTIAWIMFYLAAFPKVQEKAQKEIDDIIGSGPITVDIREKLPYVDAVLHEVMRIMPVTPSGVPREVVQNTKLNGYDIPKGTMVMPSIWAIHHDAREWPEPDAFLPERWLDDQGRYVFQQNGFMPFSVGRRSCIGESFAKLELHMLTAMLLQRYTLEPMPGHRVDLNPVDGGVVRAPHQHIMAVRRTSETA